MSKSSKQKQNLKCVISKNNKTECQILEGLQCSKQHNKVF